MDHIHVDIMPSKPGARPIWTVTETTSVADCIGVMKLHSIGAVIVVSQVRADEIVGIFSERDLVKHFEVMHMGYLWDHPVKAFMTRQLVKVGPETIHEAPKLMAKHSIRHVPVTKIDGGRERLLGLISMRDLFHRSVNTIAHQATGATRPGPAPGKRAVKIAGVVSDDPAVLELVDKNSGRTDQLVMKAMVRTGDPDTQASQLSQLDGLLIDIDNLAPQAWVEILEKRLKAPPKGPTVILFNPFLLDERLRDDLKEFASRKAIHLLSKPLCEGLLFEKFLKLVS